MAEAAASRKPGAASRHNARAALSAAALGAILASILGVAGAAPVSVNVAVAPGAPTRAAATPPPAMHVSATMPAPRQASATPATIAPAAAAPASPGAGSGDAPAPAAAVAAEIDAAIEAAARANLKPHAIQDDGPWLQRFYRTAAYAPAWTRAGRPTATAAQAVALVQAASTHGLVPTDYGAAVLEDQLRRLATGGESGTAWARFDVALTVATLHYIADLHLGRARSAYANLPREVRTMAFDPVEQLREALAANRVAQLDGLAEPGFPVYQRLKSALAAYRAPATAPFPPLPALAAKVRKIEAGGLYAGAAALRDRLVLLGDLPVGSPATEEGRYDVTLAEGVRRFQDRHGLLADGVLGARTIAELNVPPASRVGQIELSMERLRWLPYFPDGPLIAVNIPSFRLWAFDEGSASSAPVLSMRVIVGQALRTQTPAFVGEMRYIDFNPYWNVPPSITKKEIVPKLRRDPAYLAKNDMELVGGRSAAGMGSALDDAILAALRAGKLRVRQRPGATNALGTIKFVLPNDDDIYLHATPAKALFARSRRDFSHGCIRLEQPARLAQYVLRDQPEWTAERIDEAMTPGVSRTVRLSAPIPVVIFYTTAIADGQGRLQFAPDVYRLDEHDNRVLAARSQAWIAYWNLRR